MNDTGISESGSLKVTTHPMSEWAKKLSDLKASGMRMAKHMCEQGQPFKVEILATTEVQGGGYSST